MRQRPTIALALFTLAVVAFFTACGGRHRYDGRLTSADSLMQVNPDSTLAIVEGLCRDSLATEGDRAYRDLLLTQARYRCYITATSDSDINRALAYYRVHPKEREKLTRANIYKGAVMEELGFPDSAMLHYKHAEATATPNDFFNLGYAKMRMGTLYLDNYAMDGQHIKKLEEAISYFRRCSNTYYELRCMTILGATYRLKSPEKAQELLSEAMNRASQINDTSNFIFSAQNLMQAYYEKKSYAQAAKIVRKLMENRDQNLNFAFYANSADIYAKIGKPDSAEYILGLADKGLHFNAIDEIMYFESLGEIALARGDKETYNLMDKKCRLMEDSLMALDKTIDIIKTEEQETQRIQQENNKRNNLFTNWLIAVIALALIALMIIVSFYYHRRHRYDTLISELKENSESQLLEQSIATLEERQRQATDPDLNSILRLRLSAIQELYQDIRIRIDDKNKVRQIVPLSSFFKMMHEQHALLDLELKDSFWKKMRASVDQELNGIVTYVEQHYTELTQRDIKFFCLFCAGVSPQIIKMCMNITSAKTATNYRTLIIRKMGLDMSFDEFIDEYMAGNLQ